ncbi:hypothetical protein DYB35_012963 [Aphanomyces astaci]|uniref:Uncharacterized protein n=1 Tax=Aphanomyces astaci TaxID=112090 RepID=A0A3R7AE19_APHAT|nr:hypothetical protein DYB35_012963 [Aphanomyces astaci]
MVVKRGETLPACVAWNEDKNLFLNKEDRIWIPQRKVKSAQKPTKRYVISCNIEKHDYLIHFFVVLKRPEALLQ